MFVDAVGDLSCVSSCKPPPPTSLSSLEAWVGESQLTWHSAELGFGQKSTTSQLRFLRLPGKLCQKEIIFSVHFLPVAWFSLVWGNLFGSASCISSVWPPFTILPGQILSCTLSHLGVRTQYSLAAAGALNVALHDLHLEALKLINAFSTYSGRLYWP